LIRGVAGAAIALALLAACGGETKTVQPPPPPTGYTRPAEYPLGDDAAAIEQRTLRHVLDAVPATLGKPAVAWLLAPGPVDRTALRAYYDQATRAGWSPMADVGTGLAAGETAFGYQAGDRAFIVIVPPVQVGPRQLVTIATYGSPPTR
jgi:hypothetical protein